MNDLPPHQEPPQLQGGNVGCLRFFVWLMPSCVVVGLAMLFIWGASALYYAGSLSSLIGFFLISSIAATLGIGVFDAKLRRQQRQLPQDETKGDGTHVTHFFLLQLLIIPALTFTVGFGLCLSSR